MLKMHTAMWMILGCMAAGLAGCATQSVCQDSQQPPVIVDWDNRQVKLTGHVHRERR